MPFNLPEMAAFQGNGILRLSYRVRSWGKAAAVFLLLGAAAGCGPDRGFSKARAAEKKDQFQKAWELYQEFAARYPKHAAAPEALFRAGWLSQRRLNDCVVAKAFYDTVVQRYPQSDPWARHSAYYRNNCPDYFPLVSGSRWVEGDSETHGKNARVEITARTTGRGALESSSYTGVLEKTYFAGDAKFKTIELFYKKTESELMEFVSKEDPRSKTILMWPVDAGTKWSTKSGGKIFHYEIVTLDKTVKVQAGEFSNCLHVRSGIEGLPGATNEYYAPDVGRILVSISIGEGEKRITELISYKPAFLSDFGEGDASL